MVLDKTCSSCLCILKGNKTMCTASLAIINSLILIYLRIIMGDINQNWEFSHIHNNYSSKNKIKSVIQFHWSIANKFRVRLKYVSIRLKTEH
jgi:hypothetical protein